MILDLFGSTFPWGAILWMQIGESWESWERYAYLLVFFLASNYKNSFRELFIRIVSLVDYQIYVLGEYSLESQSSERSSLFRNWVLLHDLYLPLKKIDIQKRQCPLKYLSKKVHKNKDKNHNYNN